MPLSMLLDLLGMAIKSVAGVLPSAATIAKDYLGQGKHQRPVCGLSVFLLCC